MGIKGIWASGCIEIMHAKNEGKNEKKLKIAPHHHHQRHYLHICNHNLIHVHKCLHMGPSPFLCLISISFVCMCKYMYVCMFMYVCLCLCVYVNKFYK